MLNAPSQSSSHSKRFPSQNWIFIFISHRTILSFTARSLRWRNVCTAPSSVKILRRMLLFSQSSENGPVLRCSDSSKHRCRCTSLFSSKALTSFDSLYWLNILDKFSLIYAIYSPPVYCFLVCSSPAFDPLAFAAIFSSSSFFKAAFRTF